jgi:hypothetical protein
MTMAMNMAIAVATFWLLSMINLRCLKQQIAMPVISLAPLLVLKQEILDYKVLNGVGY